MELTLVLIFPLLLLPPGCPDPTRGLPPSELLIYSFCLYIYIFFPGKGCRKQYAGYTVNIHIHSVEQNKRWWSLNSTFQLWIKSIVTGRASMLAVYRFLWRQLATNVGRTFCLQDKCWVFGETHDSNEEGHSYHLPKVSMELPWRRSTVSRRDVHDNRATLSHPTLWVQRVLLNSQGASGLLHCLHIKKEDRKDK